jgi:hypothetical protein
MGLDKCIITYIHLDRTLQSSFTALKSTVPFPQSPVSTDFIFFGHTGVWTQGLMLARQVQCWWLHPGPHPCPQSFHFCFRNRIFRLPLPEMTLNLWSSCLSCPPVSGINRHRRGLKFLMLVGIRQHPHREELGIYYSLHRLVSGLSFQKFQSGLFIVVSGLMVSSTISSLDGALSPGFLWVYSWCVFTVLTLGGAGKPKFLANLQLVTLDGLEMYFKKGQSSWAVPMSLAWCTP